MKYRWGLSCVFPKQVSIPFHACYGAFPCFPAIVTVLPEHRWFQKIFRGRGEKLEEDWDLSLIPLCFIPRMKRRERRESFRNARGCALAVCFARAAASARSRRPYLRVVPVQQGAMRIQHVEWDECSGPI